jgi:hypothetical protein
MENQSPKIKEGTWLLQGLLGVLYRTILLRS